MGDKSGATEGSSIFESLFGGFSNGLSIFTNNPFRRKQEAAALTVQTGADLKDFGSDSPEQPEVENAVGDERENEKKIQKKKNSEVAKGQIGGKFQGEDEVELDDGKLKKAKREEETGSEKKSRKNLESSGLNADQELTPGSSERRKRKQEKSGLNGEELVKIGADEVDRIEDKQSNKKKKKRRGEVEEAQEGAALPDRKSEKKAVRKGGDEDSPIRGKRTFDLEVIEKKKKKVKLVEEVDSPRITEMAGVAETPVTNEERSYETRAGLKRKKETELEMKYEKKLRGVTDLEEAGGVADMDLADSDTKGKRKMVDVEDDDMLGTGKKRKLTKQQRIDNEEKLRRTIFVGNIPVSVKPKHLVTEFSQYGAVESARLRSVPLVDVKMPRRAAVITGNLNENRTSLNGYVVFKEEASAKAALTHNMKEFGGKHLRVDSAATGPSGIEYDRKRSIFVGNLPFDVEDEDLITLFHGSTPELEVEAVRVVRDPQTSAGKGFAFVCFKTKLGAESALDKKDFTMLKNRPLRLERFGFKLISGKTREKRGTVQSSGPRLRSGAEERLSKKAPASYEGARTGKRKAVMVKGREKAGSSTPIKSGKRSALPKRPAVAAKKARALQMKNGTAAPKASVGKRKRDEKGKKDLKGKKRK